VKFWCIFLSPLGPKKIHYLGKINTSRSQSTEDEDRQVLSIEAQLFELKEFAAKEKFEIVIGANHIL
jgi:hypothetical protein